MCSPPPPTSSGALGAHKATLCNLMTLNTHLKESVGILSLWVFTTHRDWGESCIWLLGSTQPQNRDGVLIFESPTHSMVAALRKCAVGTLSLSLVGV